ncbi:peptidylarginine deiminase, partial [Clostridioides difficile]|nr:peptidylarginine deiminase [Clostridioides difficile]
MKRRLAGEWEPIKGVMLAWPPFLPHKYIVDLTQNYSVYMCVPNKEEIEIAKYYLSKWGGNLKNLIFCIAPQGFDTPWVRDWGMHPIFDENGKLFLAGAEYKMSTPFVSINK